MHFVVEDQWTVYVGVGLMFKGGSLQQPVLVLGVELLGAIDDAVGAEMVDVEIQGSHQLRVYVVEADSIVTDTVLSLDRQMDGLSDGQMNKYRHIFKQ